MMPQVFVQMPGDAESWGMVELQGQLETRDQIPLDGMHIGDLHFNSKGVPQLIVGHHLLTGKVVELEKPYAVLKKRTETEQSNETGMEVENGFREYQEDGTSSSQTGIKYVVIALITKKIIFKNRPKPIITKTLAKR